MTDTKSVRGQIRSNTVGKTGSNYQSSHQNQNNKMPSNVRFNKIKKGGFGDRISAQKIN